MLTPAGCKRRQERLLKKMEEENWDCFLTSDYRTIYYLTSFLGNKDFPNLFLQCADGRTALVANKEGFACCERKVLLETYSTQRSIDRPDQDAAKILRDLVSSCPY